MSSSSSSNHYCCVPQCNSWAKRSRCKDISFHYFPREYERQVLLENNLGGKESMDRRQAWIYILKIGKTVSKFMKVCSLHFTKEDYFQRGNSGRKILKKNAVPSQNLPVVSFTLKKNEKENLQRELRRQKRTKCDEPLQLGEEVGCEGIVNGPSSHSDDDIEAAHALLSLVKVQPEADEIMLGNILKESIVFSSPTRDAQVQVEVPKVFTLCEFLKSDTSLKSFTGISNFRILNCIVHLVNKVYKDKKSRRLTVYERIILTMIKMKLDLSYACLGILFNISNELCKQYFLEMLKILSTVLKPTIYFPSSEENLANLPGCFKNFKDVRIVLDCTEIFIQKPKCLCCRIRFYSQYKSSVTVKFMTGVTPAGTISYVSEPFGGRASDKAIFEYSKLISKLDPGKDAIMVDKGFMIEDICAIHRIKLIRPPFLAKKKQLSTEEALLNREIAAARVHIERSNQRIKIFKILSNKLQWNLVPYAEHIFTIACGITNLSAPLLAEHRFL